MTTKPQTTHVLLHRRLWLRVKHNVLGVSIEHMAPADDALGMRDMMRRTQLAEGRARQ